MLETRNLAGTEVVRPLEVTVDVSGTSGERSGCRGRLLSDLRIDFDGSWFRNEGSWMRFDARFV